MLSKIRELVEAFLQGQLNLESFAQQFAELFYDVEDCGDPAAIQLAYAIEAKLADLSAGAASEQDFRKLLPAMSASSIW